MEIDWFKVSLRLGGPAVSLSPETSSLSLEQNLRAGLGNDQHREQAASSGKDERGPHGPAPAIVSGEVGSSDCSDEGTDESIGYT